MQLEMVCREILNEILTGRVKNTKDLARVKARICGKYKLSKLPRNGDVLEVATEEEREIAKNEKKFHDKVNFGLGVDKKGPIFF